MIDYLMLGLCVGAAICFVIIIGSAIRMVRESNSTKSKGG
jgi:hypothetical protein